MPDMSQPELATLAQRLDRPVVLVGLMGAGKSTVGRRLAELLGVDFVDVDEEIERAANLTVAEIFERFGEEHFRDGERRVFTRLLDDSAGKGMVIAAGGGAFSERATRRDTRPLLREGDPREKLAELRKRRLADYGAAPIWVKSGRGAHRKVALDIAKGIERWIG